MIVTDFWLSVPSLLAIGGAARADELERGAFDPLFLVKARLRDGVNLSQTQVATTTLGPVWPASSRTTTLGAA
ncbi:MAG TPA: hypothetical protein EYQ83_17975 [Acidobacteria bacterium]|nr:hypothetical protein [Acidobacteriota bacterium]